MDNTWAVVAVVAVFVAFFVAGMFRDFGEAWDEVAGWASEHPFVTLFLLFPLFGVGLVGSAIGTWGRARGRADGGSSE